MRFDVDAFIVCNFGGVNVIVHVLTGHILDDHVTKPDGRKRENVTHETFDGRKPNGDLIAKL